MTREPPSTDDTVAVTMSEQATITAEVRFADLEDTYTLYVTPRMEAENLAVRALAQMAPWLAAGAVDLFPAVRPGVLPVHHPAHRTPERHRRKDGGAGLSMGDAARSARDEIGRLGRSLDQMARRLSAALTDLERANRALRGEVERERELDRQRMAFFYAASHELKTPVTILKGQLSGMLEGVGVYQDRDKYLLRSLQTTGRMENLIGEMLAISRMEAGAAALRQEPVDLSALTAEQLAAGRGSCWSSGDSDLVSALTPGVLVHWRPLPAGQGGGEPALQRLPSTPPRGRRSGCGAASGDGRPALTVENTGARIPEEALPHLFEAFYRAENSRNRSTGGSGLGLYLVKMILDRHGAECTIENTKDGVKVTAQFLPCHSPGLPAEDMVG